MADDLRTTLATFTVHYLRHPPLVIHAWLCLAAEAHTLEQKRRCLHAVLQLDPDNQPASLALVLLDQQRPPS